MSYEIDPVEFGRQIGMLIFESIKPLNERVAALELQVQGTNSTTKSLSQEPNNLMVEMGEKLVELQTKLQEIADNGLRYRGYWKTGMKARRADTVTHDGSLYRANHDTETEPGRGNPDWNVIARKGADAK